MGNPVRPERRASDETETERANRGEWDRYADEYQQTHGRFLGDAGFVWSPEGTDEGDLHLLGDVADQAVLEIGCGAAQCSRWVLAQGGHPVGLDLSHRQLQHSRRIDDELGTRVPVVEGTGTALPFADATFDAVLNAVSIQYLTKPVEVFASVARVLRPGGLLVIATSHRMFPTKAVAAWHSLEPGEHLRLIGAYCALAGGFAAARVLDRSPRGADPLWVVVATRAS